MATFAVAATTAAAATSASSAEVAEIDSQIARIDSQMEEVRKAATRRRNQRIHELQEALRKMDEGNYGLFNILAGAQVEAQR